MKATARLARRGTARLLITAALAMGLTRALPLLRGTVPDQIGRLIWQLSAVPSYGWTRPTDVWAEPTVALMRIALPAYVIGAFACAIAMLWRKW